MSYYVVDTNVAIVANEKSEQASTDCKLSCINKIKEFNNNQHILVLDNLWLIISEYKNKLSQIGEPGIGDAFLKWVLTNQANPNRCQTVKITKTGIDSFEEFPQDREDLEEFDRSDRKFVAVALAHPHKPTILNAVDSDWKNFELSLKKIGINLEFLCPELYANS